MFHSSADSNGNSNVDSNVDSDVNSNVDSNVDSNVVSTVGSDVVSIADSDVHSNNWIPMLIQMFFHFESNVDVIFFRTLIPMLSEDICKADHGPLSTDAIKKKKNNLKKGKNIGVEHCHLVEYPLVNKQKAMERSTIFNGKIHYFDWAIFHSFLLVHQRVC